MKRLCAFAFLLMTASCSGDWTRHGQDAADGSVNDVLIQTKGSGDNRTYVFYLVGNPNTTTQGVTAFGKYVDASTGQPLIPGYLQNDTPVYDSSYGLRSQNGGYRLFIASPAVEMEPVEDGSSIEGYPYERNEIGTYVSEPVNVTLGGVYLAGEDGTEYVYDASRQVLRQPRSRLKLNFACGADIEQTTLQSVHLNNFISRGYYIPVESRFHYQDADIEQTEQLYPVDGKGALTLRTGETVNLEIDEYILSMNYGALDSEGKNKYPMPSLEIGIGGTGEKFLTFNAALGWDFKPQHTYEFTVVINSVYVNMTVRATPWTDNGETGAVVDGTGLWQITFPLKEGTVNLMDWEVMAPQTGEIG